MTAYYNDSDDFAAQWLMQLIAEGLIAPGIVDTRDMREVTANDVKGFTQVHMCAGIGVWSLALRRAGWADSRPIWTASVPCPPFSSAGKSKACPSCGGTNPVPHVGRTGYFVCCLCGGQWLADERHLWPEFWRLVRDCRPVVVCGEQVASADGRVWLDTVRASLEMLAYDPWAVDICASGFGAPHIRQRLYWMADTASSGSRTGLCVRGSTEHGRYELADECGVMRLVDSGQPRLQGHAGDGRNGHQPGRIDTDTSGPAAAPGVSDRLANGPGERCGESGQDGRRGGPGDGTQRQSAGSVRWGGAGGLADAYVEYADGTGFSSSADGGEFRESASVRRVPHTRPGPTNGLWRDADWLSCRDEKWRPVEPGTFPLADAGAYRNRVAELRGAGNAINVAQAEAFIRAFMTCL